MAVRTGSEQEETPKVLARLGAWLTKGAERGLIFRVVLAGGLGGILSWVYSVTVGEPIGVDSTAAAVVASMVLGSAAAFLAVFLIARPDLKQATHVVALALAAGISWKPVIEASGAYVSKRIDQQTEAKVDAATEQLNELGDELAEAAGPEKERVVREMVRTSDELFRLMPRISNFGDRIRVESQVARAMDNIAIHGEGAELAAARALGDVARIAAAAHVPTVAAGVNRSLVTLAKRTTDPNTFAETVRQGLTVAEARPGSAVPPPSPRGAEELAAKALTFKAGALDRELLDRIKVRVEAEKQTANATKAKRLDALNKRLATRLKGR